MAKIVEKAGIATRRIAADGETASNLGYCAAKKLLDRGIVDLQDVDFLLLCTQSPDYFLPSGACILQHRLGLSKSEGPWTLISDALVTCMAFASLARSLKVGSPGTCSWSLPTHIASLSDSTTEPLGRYLAMVRLPRSFLLQTTINWVISCWAPTAKAATG